MKVFFDLETGGLTHDQPILQISAICNDQTFDGYYTPTAEEVNAMPDKAREMHLSRQYQGTQYPNEQALIASFAFWANLICVNTGEKRLTPAGHNVAGFDFPFIKARALRYGIDLNGTFGYHCLDTMVALMVLEDITGQKILSKSLGNACKDFGITTRPDEALHNAKTDVRMTVDLYKSICKQMKPLINERGGEHYGKV